MSEEIRRALEEKAARCRSAARRLAYLPASGKDKALGAMADALSAGSREILAANRLDMEAGREKGLSKALLDRLLLNEARIADMAEGLRVVAGLPDPVSEIPGTPEAPWA
ncbi:hypothetical protein ACP3TJ_06755 [Desulforudis sp. 1088]|jgi:glutamate-5-semialdehyde dehydrogenase|uniref:hypothetical protein n=1 Tax=unclassified Candidatus Desulforudis TaxID=2635950 RepID=UPI00348C0188